MAYTALKPCNFAGQNYRIGEPIPEAVLLPGAIPGLIRMGVIAASDDSQPAGGTTGPTEGAERTEAVTIHVPVDEGTLELTVTAEALQDIFTALCGNVSEADKIVKRMTDTDALVLLSLADNRKSIKAAAEERAKALCEEGGGEQ